MQNLDELTEAYLAGCKVFQERAEALSKSEPTDKADRMLWLLRANDVIALGKQLFQDGEYLIRQYVEERR